MDPQFASRYLEPQQAPREPAASQPDAEPVSEPAGPPTPDISEPGVGFPSAEERTTSVLPPVRDPDTGAVDPEAGTTPVPPWTPTPRHATPATEIGAAVLPPRPEGGELYRGGVRPLQPAGEPAGPPAREPAAAPTWSAPTNGAHRGAGDYPRADTGQPHAGAAGGYRASGPATGPQQPAVGNAMVWPAAHGGGPAAASSWQAQAATGHLRVDDLVKTRKVPPEMGWRKAVYVASGHLVNLGAGPAEQALRDQIALIGSNIPGNYQIGVISAKGGVGKSRVAAGIGTVYGLYRTEPVIAVDANPTYGNLGRLIDPSATASTREFLADPGLVSYPKARSYTGKNPQGLEVLAGNQNVANPLALTEDMFGDTLARTRRFYQLSIIDSGPQIEHRVMKGVLEHVDALVIVGTMNFDGAAAAETTLDWLDARNQHDLLRRSVVVLNDVYRSADKEFATSVRNSLGPRVGAVTTIPWDAHLRDSAVLDFEALRRPTQRAYIALAAWLAQGFATAGGGVR
ncbi:MinD/ParA family ATP-binding protein (plasmid) [Mycolicibacterium psychrotolerans]|uniref:MinD/ParA family ATP-binding protein n=1 Tax=Mycolicibacterium psychrotolerans TaxID=216929 RepID=UPI003D678307